MYFLCDFSPRVNIYLGETFPKGMYFPWEHIQNVNEDPSHVIVFYMGK